MSDPDLIARYNYERFAPETFGPWMRFDESPSLWEKAPDFPLWDLDGGETTLGAVWSAHAYTIAEFGSFT